MLITGCVGQDTTRKRWTGRYSGLQAGREGVEKGQGYRDAQAESTLLTPEGKSQLKRGAKAASLWVLSPLLGLLGAASELSKRGRG